MVKRISGIVLIILITLFSSKAGEDTKENKTALLIVDIQNFYFPGENRQGIAGAEQASIKAKKLLQIFREKEELVVHVRHKASRGAEIHKNVKPLPSEKVITKEEVNSFKNTKLLKYLNSHNINRLVIIGMQTHMCLEAAVRAGHDYGFECVVVQDACATKDVSFNGHTVKAKDVHISTLSTLKNGGYARVVDLATIKENIEKYLVKELD